MKTLNFICLVLFCILYIPCVYCKGGRMGDYSNEWLLEADVTPEQARDLAEQYGLQYSHEVFPGFYVLKMPGLSVSRAVPYDLPGRQRLPVDALKVKTLKQQKYLAHYARGPVERRVTEKKINITDEAWPDMWYFHPDRIPSMKVYETWARGYSGMGVKIAVLDDGLDIGHPDLLGNYLSEYSYDYIYDKKNPAHKYRDHHGTWCAGIISAVKNDMCVIGVAYNSKFSAIKIFESNSFTLTASDEAMALTHQLSQFDIYSNSYGPQTEGRTFASLDNVVNAAFIKGVTEGRDGKGVIYTWAAGNGGYYDNCNYDGFVSSIYTVSITSIPLDLGPTVYSERCTSILAGTYGGEHPAISTTDINGGCTNAFSGTSAASPMAAGIIALALEANPDLTWRDVQHLIVETSSHEGLNLSTSTSGSGKKVNDYFGFGLMNAEAMVNLSLKWKPVPAQTVCHSDNITVNGQSANGSSITSEHLSDGCGNGVRYLEHVQARVMFQSDKRGALEIFLTSPSGLKSQLLTRRPRDTDNNEIDWFFMTVHHWGENPSGKWRLRVQTKEPELAFRVFHWQLILYGTSTDPALDPEHVTDFTVSHSQQILNDTSTDPALDSEHVTGPWNQGNIYSIAKSEYGISIYGTAPKTTMGGKRLLVSGINTQPETPRNGVSSIIGVINGGVVLVVVAIAIIVTVIYRRQSGKVTDDVQYIYRNENIRLGDWPCDTSVRSHI